MARRAPRVRCSHCGRDVAGCWGGDYVLKARSHRRAAHELWNCPGTYKPAGRIDDAKETPDGK